MKKPEIHQIPYTQNLIFFDTEFTALDATRGQLLSVGLVKMTGEELYLELEYDTALYIDPWVKKHVLPSLRGPVVSHTEAKRLITAFVGPETSENKKPYLMSYVNQFDAIYWYGLFGSAKDHPAFWIPIDFASILFAYGFSPNSLGKHSFYKELGLIKDEQAEHDALYDARMLREVYVKFFEQT